MGQTRRKRWSIVKRVPVGARKSILHDETHTNKTHQSATIVVAVHTLPRFAFRLFQTVLKHLLRLPVGEHLFFLRRKVDRLRQPRHLVARNVIHLHFTRSSGTRLLASTMHE